MVSGYLHKAYEQVIKINVCSLHHTHTYHETKGTLFYCLNIIYLLALGRL